MIGFELYLGVLISLGIVAWVDFKTSKISNNWSILNLTAFVGLVVLSPDYTLNLTLFLYPVIILITGFFLFVLKIMGAGDAKYLFSLFLIIPQRWHAEFLELLVLSTCLIGCMLLIVNFLRSRDKIFSAFKAQGLKGLSACFGTRFSYAPVILFGWIWLGIKFKILS